MIGERRAIAQNLANGVSTLKCNLEQGFVLERHRIARQFTAFK
jgi:hypothetical protein